MQIFPINEKFTLRLIHTLLKFSQIIEKIVC